MRRRRSYVFSPFHEPLERRLSLSAINGPLTAPPAMMPCALRRLDDDTPPDPGPDPGPFPGNDPPLAYPSLPASGPVGPGIRLR